jgi:hypothetical protein
MHGILLALTLSAYLLAPSGFLARFWNPAPKPAKAPAATTLEKEGPGLDPSGITAPAITDEGPGLDPFGHS